MHRPVSLEIDGVSRKQAVEIDCRVFVHSEGNRGRSSSKCSADAGGFSSTVDYIKMHSVSVHKMSNASEFPGPELGLTQNCSPVHNTKCMLL